MTRVELCRLAGLDQAKKIVLYAPASNMCHSAIPIIWTRIRELASTDTYLLIKLDSDACQEYKLAHRRIAGENRNIRYIDDIDITPYLHLADVMVADVSEAFLEFALLDKPVVLFNNPNRREDPDYRPEDVAYAWRDIGIQVTTFSGIKTAVTRCFENPDELSENRRYYREKMGIRLDGNASGRVVEQMRRLLEGEKAIHQERSESVSEDIYADSGVDETIKSRIHGLATEIGTIIPHETEACRCRRIEAEAHLGQSKHFLGRGNAAKAVEEARKAIEKYPSCSAARYIVDQLRPQSVETTDETG